MLPDCAIEYIIYQTKKKNKRYFKILYRIHNLFL